MRIGQRAWLILAWSVLQGSSLCVLADQPSAPSAAPAPGLEEIVVTATKRSESLQDVPLSISALSARDLQVAAVKSLRDVAALTPGVEFDRSVGGPLTNIAVRGVNSTVGASTTGIYIDDTPIQSRVSSISAIGNPLPLVYDLQRVEVIRGPQGTLFGAGAEGGALRFITSDPDLVQSSGSATVEVADTRYGSASYEAGVAGGGPLSANTVGIRASAWYRRDGGYIDRVDPFTGATVDANSNYSNSESFRIALLIQPVEWLTITPSVDYQKTYVHDIDIYYPALSDPDSGQFQSGKLLRQPTSDDFTLATIKLQAAASFADITSITSFFHRNADTLTDTTQINGIVGGAIGLGGGAGGYGNPAGPAYPVSYADAAPQHNAITQRNISEEIRLSSRDAAARLTWVAGIFASYAKQHEPSSTYSNDDDVVNALPPGTSVLYSDITIVDRQLALFGEADWRFTDRWKLTAGLRIARTEFESEALAGGAFEVGVASQSSGQATERPVTPKVGLSYQADRDNLFYLTAYKGYRIGGVNAPLPNYCVGTAPSTYHSDSLWSYEIGAKNTLLGGRLVLDSSAFHIVWTNVQQPVVIAQCGYTYLANTGQAHSDGADLAGTAQLGAHTRVGFSFAYTDSKFTKTVTIPGAVPGSSLVVVQSGDSIGLLPQVPSPFNATVYVEYSFPFVRGSEGFARIQDVFNSRNNGPFSTQIPNGVSYNPDLVSNPSTNVLDLRVGAKFGSYDVSVFVNNVLNAHPALATFNDAPGSTLFYNTTLRPLTAGVTAHVQF
jgi:iron complex outermembrane recepter protein